MWMLFAVLSAVFAALTSILAKLGIKKTPSTVATAVRTVIVLVFAWPMVFITGHGGEISEISSKSLLFLVLSGLATGGSWLCYFRALSLGDVNKVVPVDKSSTVLSVLFAIIILGETGSLAIRLAGIVLIGAGTFLMIEFKEATTSKSGRKWLIYALASAVFAALTSILGKIGIEGVDSNLATALRTCVVLIMAWVCVFDENKRKELRSFDKKELLFICLSGLATGGSWLCFFRALSLGDASLVIPIDKLSIVFTVIFSRLVLGEKPTKKALAGLLLIVTGTVGMTVLS